MGSRLFIALLDLLGMPEVTVLFKTVYSGDNMCNVDSTAEVRMVSPFKDRSEDFVFMFDVDTCEGKQLLSMDFNFFRYSLDDDRNKLLRLMYEYSICFRVVH